MRLRVLGPLDARVGGVSVSLGGPRQRAVLALLVAMRGDVVSVDRMIEDLWRGEPPAKAIASLQSYVANLRRTLEPDRPPRAPAEVLVSAAPGYAIRLDADAVDAWRFEQLTQQARTLGERDPAAARKALGEALGLWRGEAFAEVADEEWAIAESVRLGEIRLGAQELLVEVTLRSAPAIEAVPGAELLTRRHPLREESWRLLALALWGSGRQADALAALRRARHILAEELGLDPGPALAELEQAILGQDLSVLTAATRAPAPQPVRVAAAAEPRESASARVTEPLFVGRETELGVLTGAAGEVLAGGSRLALISGEPGAGKTTLINRLIDGLDPARWRIAAGRCPEDEGAPPAWAWIEALRPLTGEVPLGGYQAELAPLLGEGQHPTEENAAVGRFRLHRAVCAWLRGMTGDPARNGPAAPGRALAILLDDLHRADAETLGLLTAVAEELAGARILLVAAFRPSDVTESQENAFAQLARLSPIRLPLAGLSAGDIGRLVTSICARPVDEDTMASLAERTGGNPFYVRESARLLDSEGRLGAVPDGVRDVLRRRLARLPAPAVSVLRLAAVVGREAEVEVLVGAADADEDGVLDALEAGVLTGLLTEPAPGRVRFAHALVRDTLHQDLSQMRRARTHARVADSIARLHPGDLPALAHHYARAATSATAERAMDYSLRAGELATRRYAHDTAADLFAQALECFERVPGEVGDRDARRIELLARLVRAQVLSGDVAAARETRRRAIDLAEEAGRDDLLIIAFTCWTEATPWQIKPYGMVDERMVDLLTRLLRRADIEPLTRCGLLEMLASELEGDDDQREVAAAAELAELAATLGDPVAEAAHLIVEIRHSRWETEPRRVIELAERLAEVGAAHHMVAYRWYGEFAAARGACLLGDLPRMRAHLDRAQEIAKTYQMVEARAVGAVAEATLAHIAGRLAEAEQRFKDAYTAMARAGSIHADSALAFSVFGIRLDQDRLAEYAPVADLLFETHGRVAADVVAICLLAAGQPEQAQAARARGETLRRDYYYSMYAVMRGLAVARLGTRAEMAEMIELLGEIRDIVPGTASLSVAARPVAHTIGDLLLAAGRPAEAAENYRHAAAIARIHGAVPWAAQAEEAARKALGLVSKTAPRGGQEG
ncbi:ATPase AAA [Acrocarpospora phusangensis]|uniref:ATPase AAA n=1 Tax=Acrocarpospora phusangensis TaxID=1070424 RepID=A0A919UP55_9ACTN|nr:ATPase AAA [Acrocarpospora phusangensis]